MKKLIIIPFLFFSLFLSATNYYVKTGGNDGNTGLSDAQAWATITKVNTVWAAGTFAPGDIIYFNKGNSFTGTIEVKESGSSGNPITISAYGTGADPIINGFTTVTGWSDEGGGIYSKTVVCESAHTFVVSLDGVHTAMGRWPNSGWTTYDSFSGNTQLTDATLSGEDWAGAEAVVRVNAFTINHTEIFSHIGSTITFGAMSATLTSGNGFFIQNHLETLNAYGEWFYDGSDIYMYFGVEDPDDHTVKIAALDNGIEVSGYSYITVENLNIQGYNSSGVYLYTCPYTTVQDCEISFCFDGIDGPGYGNFYSPYCVFTNNTIHDINSCGISLNTTTANNQQFNNVEISYNTIYNIGLLRGGGEPTNIVSHYGICYGGSSYSNTVTSIIEHNRLSNIGYIGISFRVNDTEIRYNVVNGFCEILADGGAYYTYKTSGMSDRHAYVHHNFALNGEGDMGGCYLLASNYYLTFGFYCDGSTRYIRVENNVAAHITKGHCAGYVVNGNDYGTLMYNTFFDCTNGIRVSSSTAQENSNMTHNISFARTAPQITLYALSGLTASTITDYNYYCSPIDNDADGLIYYSGSNYTLLELQTERGQDVHSNDSPVSVSADSEIHFIYNDTTINKHYNLSATMVDVTGASYSVGLELEPFSSLILLGAGTVTETEIPVAGIYYVSTTGDDDTGTGSITEPWATWAYGVNRMSPGDILYIRGGTYRTTGTGASTVHSRWENVWGTAEDTIRIWAYPGEYPVFNLDNITMTAQYTYVVFLTNCRYLHVKGLRIIGMYQQPYGSEGTVIHNMRFSNTQHCVFEQLEVDHSGLWGFMLASGSHYNLFLNCDAHHLTDPYTGWDASDGFARTGGSTANYNTYRYCRAWLCCDDGWDHFSTDGYTTLEGCWAFWNGWSDENRTTHLGNGVGFKLGPGATNQTAATRVLTNCLSAQNYFHGLDQNFHEGTGEFASHIYNCTAYDNGGYGFRMRPYDTSNGSNADILRNNIAYDNDQGTYLGDAGDTQDHNTWNGDVTLTSADFVSLDVSQMDDLRQADGSLPDITFGHLATGSDLIDAGVDVGLPYTTLPDMGCFEYIGGIQIVLPTVTTTAISNIHETTATGGGNVTSAGNGTVSARGVCWSIYSNPTITDDLTSNGTGTGVFTSYLINLFDNTHYYVRAYATNEIGTSYGSNREFTTLEYEEPEPPPDIPKIILIDKDGNILKSKDDNFLKP